MKRIQPFRALRYNKNIIGDLGVVLAPPYDVISKEQQEKLFNSHPFNVIRLELGAEIENEEGHSSKYISCADTLSEWMQSGILLPEKQPAFYVYEQNYNLSDGTCGVYKGIIALVRLDEMGENTIFAHQDTLTQSKTDRFSLISECEANFNPVHALYTDSEHSINKILLDELKQSPEILAKMNDTVHKLWTVNDQEKILQIEQLLKDKDFFIADGHNRYETAINYRNAMREKNPDYLGEESYNYIMMFLAEMDQKDLLVLPTHRMVKDVVGYSEQRIVTELEPMFSIQKIMADDIENMINEKLEEIDDMPSFIMYSGKDYFYKLKLKDLAIADKVADGMSSEYRYLGVTLLHSIVFKKILGMTDIDMRNRRYLSYKNEVKRATDGVKNGEYQCAFMVKPIGLNDIISIARAGEKLPQKSTNFYPKVITGLVINKLS